MKHPEALMVLLTLVLLVLFTWPAQAQTVAPTVRTERPAFTFCADPSATSHTVCMVVPSAPARTQCQELAGGQWEYRVEVTPPLCRDFFVTAVSRRVDADGTVSEMFSDPSKTYRGLIDIDLNGVVGLSDYGLIANGFGTRYRLADVACMASKFGQAVPAPAPYESASCPVPNVLPTEPPVVGP